MVSIQARILLFTAGILLPLSCAGTDPDSGLLFKGYVEIGGMDQWIMVRGAAEENPLLLWLHGGPGSSQSPVADYPDSGLEELFTVVHWDQRGAGKSNPGSFDESTMTMEQFVRDAHELTVYLKRRYGREKIALLGHSWGTVIGMQLAERYPEDYFCYIGVSQVVDALEGHIIAHEWASGREGSGELEEPPYTDHGDYVRFAKKIDALGGGMDVSFGVLLRQALKFEHYGFFDYLRWMNGANRGSGPMWEESLEVSFPHTIPEVQLPVIFFSGRNDYNTPAVLVEEYFGQLDAPQGKEFVLFPESSHTPFWKEPDRFLREMGKVRDRYCR